MSLKLEKILTKEELITQLKEWSEKEFIEQKEPVSSIIDQYKRLTREEERSQLKAHRAVQIELEEEDQSDFVFEVNPLDEEFDELAKQYGIALGKYTRALKDLHIQNLEKKWEIIDKLRTLTSTEISNIGSAFSAFNELVSEWEGVGEVNQSKYKALQYEYSHLRDIFFYNVNIHKELKDYDLKKNLNEKLAIIKNLKGLDRENSIIKLEHALKDNQNKWDKIGPTYQEKWEEIKQEYWCQVVDINERVSEYYQILKQTYKDRFVEKEALLAKAKEAITKVAQYTKVKDWKKPTEEIIQLQNDWKKIGSTGKLKSKIIWEEFKDAIDSFFVKKSAFFDQLKGNQSNNEAKKEDLVKKAENVKESTDWKRTNQYLIKLQQEWKRVGAAHPKKDHKLWLQFREACNYFFDKQKHYFDTKDDREAENLVEKNKAVDIITQVDSKEKLLEAIAAWNQIGYVPRDKSKESKNALNKAINEVVGKLGLNEEEKRTLLFEAKVTALKTGDNPERELKDEMRFAKDQMKKIQDEIAQYEQNMAFFGPSKGAQKLKEAVEKRMQTSQSKLESWKEKVMMIKKTLDLLKK